MPARNIAKSLLLTRHEWVQLSRSRHELEETLDCSVAHASFVRALIRLALQRGDAILDAAAEHEGELTGFRRGDEQALVRFEETLAKVVEDGLLWEWEDG